MFYYRIMIDGKTVLATKNWNEAQYYYNEYKQHYSNVTFAMEDLTAR